MNTGGIIAPFFGLAFLIAVLIATRVERYLRAQKPARFDQGREGFLDFATVAIQPGTVGQANAQNAGAAIVAASCEEYDLPDLTEISCKPRATLEFLGFGRKPFLNRYSSTELILCLAPITNNHIPINGILRRRHSGGCPECWKEETDTLDKVVLSQPGGVTLG